jgi:hypothetical protein
LRGSLNVVGRPWKIIRSGFSQVSPSTFSGGGGGVSRLTITHSTLQMQNAHHACIMKGMPQRWLTIFSSPKTGGSSKNDAAPIRNPKVSVTSDASSVPRRQNPPNRNTVVIGGARSAAMTLMASKMLEYRPPSVDHSIARIITTTEAIRAMFTCARSLVCGRIRCTRSTATSVPELLSAADTVLISAASTAAEISLSVRSGPVG